LQILEIPRKLNKIIYLKIIPKIEDNLMNLLLVDDEPEYLFLLSHFLTDQGYTVFTAEHGEAGLKVLDQESIDLIISDVYMPVMDGFKFHKAIRSSTKFSKIPFLFVSGFDDEYTLSAVKSSKLDGFCRKARPMNELKEWISYLSTPADKRPMHRPGQQSAIKDKDRDRSRDRSLNSRR
jgi:response regulator RpfG family c-di-GMP phosphodiesterase